MTALRFDTFHAVIPRRASRQLPDAAAQIADSVNLLSGEIRPLKVPHYVTNTGAGKLAVYRAEYSGAETWRAWAMDVDVQRAPLPFDVESRYMWSGDGPPKWSTYTNFGTVASDLTLGIPTPQTLPTVTPSGGVGATTTRTYVYTFMSQHGEESAPSPETALLTGKVDDTWAITGMDAVPASSGSVKGYYSAPSTVVANATGASLTVTGATNATPIVITTSGSHGLVTGNVVNINSVGGNTAANNSASNPTWTITYVNATQFSLNDSVGNGAYTSGGTAKQCTYHWLRARDQITISATAMTVSATGASYYFTVSGDYSAASTWARVANWNTTGMTRKLYRAAGTTGEYQLVAENISGTTYNDTIIDANLPGDDLLSSGWVPPPTNLTALYVLPNGSMVGLSGTLLCYSEPYQVHAWPEAYQFGLANEGVGLAAFGSTVVVGTTGAPYMADGADPTSVSLQRYDTVWPCLSKRSAISVGDGVIYSTSVGLVYLGTAGAKVFTQDFYTREEWRALDPASMVTAYAEGCVFVRYKALLASTASVLIFRLQEPTAALTTYGYNCNELYADSRNGYLYLADSNGTYQFDAGVGNKMVYTWKSKDVVPPMPVNFGAAEVDFISEISAADAAAAIAAYNAALAAQPAKIANGVGALNGGQGGLNESALNGYTPVLPELAVPYVTFTLFTDGTSRFSKTLYESGDFRLPSGYKTEDIAIQVSGNVRIKCVKLADTMRELGKI